jgi:hypothetical protein
MRKFIFNHFSRAASAGLLCLVAVVAFSCAKKPQDQIVGKWNVEGTQPVTVEFHKDGTVITTVDGKETPGTYKFVGETNMETVTYATIGTNKLTVNASVAVAIHGDNADLTVKMQQQAGMPPTAVTTHLQRAK